MIYTCISKKKSLQSLKKTKSAIFLFAQLPWRQWDIRYMYTLVWWLLSTHHVLSENTLSTKGWQQQQGWTASSPVLTIPPGLFLFQLSLRSILNVLLCSLLPPDSGLCWEPPEPASLFPDTLHACEQGGICSSLLALVYTNWWQQDFCLLWYALYHFYLHLHIFNGSYFRHTFNLVIS